MSALRVYIAGRYSRRAELAKVGLLFFSERGDAGYMSGGRHVEWGYAIARGLHLWLVGFPENVFHHVRRAQVFASVDEWERRMFPKTPTRRVSREVRP